MILKALSVKKLKCFSVKLVGYFVYDHSPGHFARAHVAFPPNKNHPSGESYREIAEFSSGLSSNRNRNVPYDLVDQRPAITDPESTARPRPPQPWINSSK